MPAVVLQVVSLLVGEIILCIKEVNKKTRVAAYELLVSLAKAMHENDPPTLNLPVDDSMGKSLPEPSTSDVNRTSTLAISDTLAQCLWNGFQSSYHTIGV